MAQRSKDFSNFARFSGQGSCVPKSSCRVPIHSQPHNCASRFVNCTRVSCRKENSNHLQRYCLTSWGNSELKVVRRGNALPLGLCHPSLSRNSSINLKKTVRHWISRAGSETGQSNYKMLYLYHAKAASCISYQRLGLYPIYPSRHSIMGTNWAGVQFSSGMGRRTVFIPKVLSFLVCTVGKCNDPNFNFWFLW